MASEFKAMKAAQQVDTTAASLVQTKERLLSEIAAKRSELLALPGNLSAGDDFETIAQTDSIAEVDTAEIERDLQELRAVELALTRLENGQYGQCDQCGEQIPAERLKVQPAAVYCVKCQESIEAGTSA